MKSWIWYIHILNFIVTDILLSIVIIPIYTRVWKSPLPTLLPVYICLFPQKHFLHLLHRSFVFWWAVLIIIACMKKCSSEYYSVFFLSYMFFLSFVILCNLHYQQFDSWNILNVSERLRFLHLNFGYSSCEVNLPEYVSVVWN